ncbi:hypothetical protein [Spirosoma utsteinense]|uniref:DNA polymerase III psi subunit n=1 Tax=Spirosoma utsteinense TaxID=2585773 RepID=A0ABR6W7G6_9BACT|nr:hypothetical protein [Spirosoma utsteinense]MBC3786251.1 DNA polymerase III psi subunit [Spirosoma utsteinense]MBC3791877.1 DNA polymerase III psi subunit [Spirosoma utsteinense]
MSATNFYQTFYQTEQLFRLDNERWGATEPITEKPSSELIVEPVSQIEDDFLVELDRLATSPEPIPLVVEHLAPPPVVAVASQPEPVVLITTPEPLPQPAPRPTTPSILPPIQQQARLPQLNHKVLLLADEELDPSNLLFLEKILKAVNLNVNGVDLLNLHGVQNIDFAELLKGKYINHFITFGVPFERINLDIMMDRYAPVRFEGINFLMADSLPTIEADQNLKKRLWSALQRVFLQRYA